jgi:hypothetical protein
MKSVLTLIYAIRLPPCLATIMPVFSECQEYNLTCADRCQEDMKVISGGHFSPVFVNRLVARSLNVDDARVMTIGWILGVLLTLSEAIVVFFVSS